MRTILTHSIRSPSLRSKVLRITKLSAPHLFALLTAAACAPEAINRKLHVPTEDVENPSHDGDSLRNNHSDQREARAPERSNDPSLQNTNLTDEDREINDHILQWQTDRLQADIDSPEFKVTGLRVGVEEKLLHSVPVVVFFPVPMADFYQLIRCESDADIRGPFSTLDDAELLSANPDDETQTQTENRFWTVAETHGGCITLTEALVKTVYHDTSLPDGSYKYLARACVFDSKHGTQCSIMVSQSTELIHYRNESSNWDTFLLEEVAQKERIIEDLSLRLAILSRQFASSIVSCEQENNRRVLSLQKKNLLSEILLLGAQIGGHLTLNDFSTPLEAESSVWTPRADFVNEEQPLMTLLKDLFVTENDLQLSCTEAEFLSREAQLVLQEIEALKQVVNTLSGTSSAGGQL